MTLIDYRLHRRLLALIFRYYSFGVLLRAFNKPEVVIYGRKAPALRNGPVSRSSITYGKSWKIKRDTTLGTSEFQITHVQDESGIGAIGDYGRKMADLFSLLTFNTLKKWAETGVRHA